MLHVDHDVRLVVLSLVLALLTATMLLHIGRGVVHHDARHGSRLTLLAAASTGVGVWAMHFVALLAVAKAPADVAPAPWWGYALLLAAAVCEASYVVIGKRLTAGVSPRRISALINLWGLVLVTPLAGLDAMAVALLGIPLPICAELLPKPVLDQVQPMRELKQACARMEQRAVVGKLVLTNA